MWDPMLTRDVASATKVSAIRSVSTVQNGDNQRPSDVSTTGSPETNTNMADIVVILAYQDLGDGCFLPVFVPSPPNASVLFIDYQVDISQSFWYTDPTVDTRIAGPNDDNFQTSKILYRRIIELERRVCSNTIRTAVGVDAGRVDRKVRNSRHGQ